jgi:carboxypeptidase C (cathepsin A)
MLNMDVFIDPAVLDEATCQDMKDSLPFCLDMAKKCYATNNPLSCSSAYWYCNQKLVEPYGRTGLSIYDIRIKDDPKKHDGLTKFVNHPETRKQLGIVDHFKVWVPCSDTVGWEFRMAGDK